MNASRVLFAILGFAMIGCARSAVFDELFPPPSTSVTVRVVNEDIASTRVYLMRGNIRIRLGSVGGLESRTFRISEADVEPSGLLSLAVRALGSLEIFTPEPVLVTAGDFVDLILRRNPRQSRLTVLVSRRE